jgi:hypothetical protein
MTDRVERDAAGLLPAMRLVGSGGRAIRPAPALQLESAVTIRDVTATRDVRGVDADEIDGCEFVLDHDVWLKSMGRARSAAASS